KPKRKNTQVPQPSGSTKHVADEAAYKELDDRLEIIIIESSFRRDLRLVDEEGVDCLPNSTIFENLELMGTMASAVICLAINQKFNFSKLIFDSMIRNLDNASGKFLMYPRKPKRKNTQVPQPSGSTKHVADEAAYKELDDRLDRMKLNELVELCTTLQSKVLDLEKTKTTQALEITSLKRRVKKLEKKQRSRTHKLKRLYKGREINDIDADEDITLVNDQDDAEMFDVTDLHGEEVFVEKELTDKEVNDEVQKVVEEVVEDINIAKLIVDATQVSATGKKDYLQELSESTTTTKIISSKKSQDKGKSIMVEENVKLKNKDQIRLDEEAALKLQAELQAEFKEEQRLAREKLRKN
nr:hypothetical protein [Tanacetum cinerariifolium]